MSTPSEKTYTAAFESPIGTIEITSSETAIKSLYFRSPDQTDAKIPQVLADCLAELDAYFNGELQHFTSKLAPEGTKFQQSVWHLLESIPFGKTVSYMDLAKRMNNPGAVRAVGAANGANRISIILPCHRVIGSSGKMTGYGGEIWRKEWLLQHEQKIAGGLQLGLF